MGIENRAQSEYIARRNWSFARFGMDDDVTSKEPTVETVSTIKAEKDMVAEGTQIAAQK